MTTTAAPRRIRHVATVELQHARCSNHATAVGDQRPVAPGPRTVVMSNVALTAEDLTGGRLILEIPHDMWLEFGAPKALRLTVDPEGDVLLADAASAAADGGGGAPLTPRGRRPRGQACARGREFSRSFAQP